MDKITIIGNLGKDPEMRFTPSGQPVTSFSVASNRKYTNNSGEAVKETTWFRISAWGKLAETCNQYLKKGRLVYVEGRLTPDKNTGGPRVWTRQDGSPAASFEVTAACVEFLGGGDGAAGAQLEAGAEAAPGADDAEANIPF
jgi:single-strand DNA-binding protein